MDEFWGLIGNYGSSLGSMDYGVSNFAWLHLWPKFCRKNHQDLCFSIYYCPFLSHYNLMPSQLDIREWLMISDRICPRMRSTSLLVRSIRQQWASGEEDQGSTIIVQSTFRWIFSQLELTQDHVISWYSHSCSKWCCSILYIYVWTRWIFEISI